MRKSFWELATTFAGFKDEISSLNEIFNIRKYCIDGSRSLNTIRYYIDNEFYPTWAYKHKITFPNIYSLMQYLGIFDLSSRAQMGEAVSLEKFLLYTETIYNLVSIDNVIANPFIVDPVLQLKHNIEIDCERLGFEIKKTKEEKYIIVEKNAAATAVADKYADTELDLSFKVIEYNHFLLKGNIDRKEEILLALWKKFEPVAKRLAASSFKSVADDAGYLLNNLDIRHSNTSPEIKNYKPHVAQMPPKELEEWYDKTYNILLLALLADDFSALHKEIKELKAQIEAK